MVAMRQGRGSSFPHIAILVLAMSMFFKETLAAQYVVGGELSKWSFLHANSNLTFYNDWAKSIALKTGDTLLFQYENVTHNVLQLGTEAEYTACTLPKTPVGKWLSGRDSVFISNAGTYYFICGTPAHCAQGMKFTIAATGAPVAAPPPPPPVAIAPGPANHATPTTILTGTISLFVALLLSAALVVPM